MTELTNAILHYKHGRMDLNEVIKKTAIFIYKYIHGIKSYGKDIRSDFFTEFYSKIPKLINKFVFTGISFESYIAKTVRWQIKTYCEKIKMKALHYKIFSNANFYPLSSQFVKERPAYNLKMTNFGKSVLKITKDKENIGAKRRLLILALKASKDIPLEYINKLAESTGFDENYILSCIDELNNKMNHQNEKLQKYQLVRNKYILKSHIYHEQLHSCPNDYQKEQLEKKLTKIKERYKKVQKYISKIPKTPQHKDIANVLNIPKGSVDSGLFYLKRSYNNLKNNKDDLKFCA